MTPTPQLTHGNGSQISQASYRGLRELLDCRILRTEGLICSLCAPTPSAPLSPLKSWPLTFILLGMTPNPSTEPWRIMLIMCANPIRDVRSRPAARPWLRLRHRAPGLNKQLILKQTNLLAAVPLLWHPRGIPEQRFHPFSGISAFGQGHVRMSLLPWGGQGALRRQSSGL